MSFKSKKHDSGKVSHFKTDSSKPSISSDQVLNNSDQVNVDKVEQKMDESKIAELKKDRNFKKISEQTEVKTELIETTPYFEGDKESRNIYKVTVKRNGKQISFRFGDSIHNTEQGIEPTKYDILATITAEAYVDDDFENFCGDFGYDVDPRKAEKLHKACKAQSAKISQLFNQDEIQKLVDEGFA